LLRKPLGEAHYDNIYALKDEVRYIMSYILFIGIMKVTDFLTQNMTPKQALYLLCRQYYVVIGIAKLKNVFRCPFTKLVEMCALMIIAFCTFLLSTLIVEMLFMLLSIL